jgi:Domain of unknown function (DUF4259)
MGTWDSGPFSNDAALDCVGDFIDKLNEPINEFLASPEIDETFDACFAAIAILNIIMQRTVSRPYRAEGYPAQQIADTMLRCFDEQIDGMEPDENYKHEHRAALVVELATFVELCSA